ncbi:hypothetical protein [Ligilactobacillus salivarius]|uniref:hypothetical protein n=1 Tax=Ligilactobacillus salivarius TaxID=1624 RepID=UPI000BB017E8|nr:hypothetical protein [Ligilactobacillus salivarius]NME24177.1 hypothetical protein [Ligilactobacillus salivarius]PAY37382.1 hypothetical protein A8C54_04610 [Ligilactobacillus salivarius]PAY42192.1 hypothetical protein A8C34_03585 [Ligilactobacillus salivarius]
MKELIVNGIITLGIVFIISSYLTYMFEFDDNKIGILDLVISVGAVTALIIICMTILIFFV